VAAYRATFGLTGTRAKTSRRGDFPAAPLLRWRCSVFSPGRSNVAPRACSWRTVAKEEDTLSTGLQPGVSWPRREKGNASWRPKGGPTPKGGPILRAGPKSIESHILEWASIKIKPSHRRMAGRRETPFSRRSPSRRPNLSSAMRARTLNSKSLPHS